MISVLTPTYNRPVWLKQCIDSVLASECVDLEMIACDNGSTWETGELLAAYDDDRLRHFRLGANDVKLAGEELVSRAAGEYMLILPDDDVIVDPMWLADACGVLDSHPNVGLCWSLTRDMESDGEPMDQERGKLAGGGGSLFDQIFPHNSIPMSACVFRSKFAHHMMGGPGRYFGEWWLWLKILHESDGATIQRVTTMLRQHECSESRAGYASRGFLDAHEHIWKYWIGLGYKPSHECIEAMAHTWVSMSLAAGVQCDERFLAILPCVYGGKV